MKLRTKCFIYINLRYAVYINFSYSYIVIIYSFCFSYYLLYLFSTAWNKIATLKAIVEIPDPTQIEPKTLGEKIKKYRLLKGITQIQLAEKIGLKKTQIYHYEYDKSFPPLPTLNKIAEILELPSDYLMDDYYRFISNDSPTFFRTLRENKNWNYRNIQEELGICYPLYYRWENGVRQISRKIFERIKEKLY